MFYLALAPDPPFSRSDSLNVGKTVEDMFAMGKATDEHMLAACSSKASQHLKFPSLSAIYEARYTQDQHRFTSPHVIISRSSRLVELALLVLVKI